MKKTTLLFLSTLFALAACKKGNKTVTYELGQNCLGGIVIKLDASKEHGLVAALSDQVTFAQHLDWGQSKAACEAVLKSKSYKIDLYVPNAKLIVDPNFAPDCYSDNHVKCIKQDPGKRYD